MDLPACAPCAPKKKKAMQGLQRCKAPLAPGFVQGEGHDHVMTKAEYAEWNRGGALLKQLRCKDDPAPRTMAHGCGEGKRFCPNVAGLLAANAARGSQLVRGYKLAHIPLTSEQWQGVQAWKATFHMVVAHPPEPPATKWIYEDPNQPFHTEDRGKAYIFVPSSRAHAELCDEEVLSGKWTLGFVVGGNHMFCEMVIADQSLRGRRKSVIALTPERCIAKRMAKVYLMPCFAEWHTARGLREDMDGVAEMMGFPTTDIDDAIDMTDHKAMRTAIQTNPEALVDGMQTLYLMLQHCTTMMEGLISTDEVRVAFFRHYDLQKKTIDDKIARKLEAELGARGFGQGLTTAGMC
jgi:hypothetical protein